MFEYDPIPGEGFIRVLILLRGTGVETINCRLQPLSLNEAEMTYTAISYVWGDLEDTLAIFCNGQPIMVTRNLHDALVAVRDPHESKHLWVDAVCINQDDLIERGLQVKRMDEIYRNAREVLVWLGRDVQGVAGDCFDLIQQTNRNLEPQLETYGDPHAIPTFQLSPPISEKPSRWTNIITLMNLPWFSRVWVVQEAAVSNSCVLVWGNERLDIAELCEFSLWVGRRMEFDSVTFCTGPFTDIFYLGYCTYGNRSTWLTRLPLEKFSFDRVRQHPPSFAHVLDLARSLDSTCAADRVYAFLGNPLSRRTAADGRTALLVEPNYEKSTEDVFLEAASAMLQNIRDASFVLPMVVHEGNQDVEAKSLPSWVPRWDRGSYREMLALPIRGFQSGGARSLLQIKVQGRLLQASAFPFEHVVWISELGTEGMKVDRTVAFHNRLGHATPPVQLYIDTLWQDLQKGSENAEEADHENLSDGFACAITLRTTDRLGVARDYVHDYRLFCRHQLQTATDEGSTEQLMDSTIINARNAMYGSIALRGLRLAVTKSGLVSLVPRLSMTGDIITIIPGIPVPLCLRPLGEHRYNLVGDCYLHGFMEQGTVDKLKAMGFVETSILII